MNFSFYGKQAIIKSRGKICSDVNDLVNSDLFCTVVRKFLYDLREKDSPLLSILSGPVEEQDESIITLLKALSAKTYQELSSEFSSYFSDRYTLLQFVEQLYNYWRAYERFFILDAADEAFDERPYSAFQDTVEHLNHLVRKTYRDICEHISGDHPRIYRQVPAGAHVGLIVKREESKLPIEYAELANIPLIKQSLIEPPMIIDPPMNKRKGSFLLVEDNPLLGLNFNPEEWICYPAIVGNLVIHLYCHNQFIGLGASVSNLFEIADGELLKRKPDAIYAYGVEPSHLSRFGEIPTVFYEDKENDLFVGAVPRSDDFGYFGYIKKMLLTIHNSIMMKRGRLPVHGAMVKIQLKNGKSANIVIMGDSGAGKSESLEAFRILSKDYLRDMTIVFDDMGSLELGDELLAYGTETGAFVRLDDLQPGFAFGNIDRSIIMSPQKINARAVLPISTLQEIQKGEKVDYFLYANNYEQVDDSHPHLEEFKNKEEAMKVFSSGARIAKGTTSEKGLVKTYYANIFGPVQYKELHDELAQEYFSAFFSLGVYVGQIRTRLGIPGYETNGPQEAAKALFELIA